jgi:hypothetical protein
MIDEMLDIAGAELGSPLRAHASMCPLGGVFQDVTAAFSTGATRANVTVIATDGARVVNPTRRQRARRHHPYRHS